MLLKYIIKHTQLNETSVKNTLSLLKDDSTIPFISRYRKEATGSLDEVQIANIRDRNEQLIALDKRRDAIIESIDEQGFLTDELHGQLRNALVISELEDIYESSIINSLVWFLFSILRFI